MEHGKSTGSNVHSIVSFTYANAAARLAAVTADFTAEDIDKVAKQLDDGSRWLLDAISPAVVWTQLGSSGVKSIRIPLTLAGTQSSSKFVLATDVVHDCLVNITTPFTPGTTMKVGRAGSLALLQNTTDNDPTVANIYDAPQDTDWGGVAGAVVVTLLNGGAIAAGAGFVTILYSTPSA